MKKGLLEFLIISSIFGSIFGVGIVSGQEALQMFIETPFPTAPKIAGYVILLMIVAFVILDYSAMIKPKSFVDIIVKKNNVLKLAVQFFFVLLSFVGLTLMFAGAGSVLNGVTGANVFIGSLILSIFICIIGIGGSQAILKLFNFAVPLVIVICLGTAMYGLFNPNIVILKSALIKVEYSTLSYFLPILYVFYCASLLVTVLVPIASRIRHRKVIARGTIATGIIFFLASSAVCFALIKFQTTVEYTDLPMLEVARYLSPVLGGIYLVALVCGIISSPSAIIFGMINFFSTFDNKYLKNRKIVVPILCLLALLASQVGFSKIIALAVPTIGSISMLICVTIIINYIRTLRNDGFKDERY
ncbi:MAG: hypothetical protein RR543_02260 [Erysipelotrichales bacterium]